MPILWALPPLVMLAGALLALVQLRGIAEAAGDLQVELQRFSDVQMAVARVRSASADVRATTRGLRRV